MTVVECCPLCRGRCLHQPAIRPGGGCRVYIAARSRPQCRAGVHARRWGLAAAHSFRDDASTAARRRRFGAQSTKCRLLARRLPPAEHRARPCPALREYLHHKAAMHRLLSPAAQCQPLGKRRDPAAPVLRPAPVMIIVATLGQVNAEQEAGPPVLPAPAADRKKR